VGRWLKDDRWPFARSAPWDAALVPQIQSWAARTLAANPAAPEISPSPASRPAAPLAPDRQVKLALALEKLEAQKFTNQLRRGEFHSIADCQQHRVRQILETRTRLLSMVESLPFDADQKQIVRGRLLEILAFFAGDGPAPAQK
jgi:hypothetical protein